MSAEEARGTGETTNIGEPTGTGEYSAQSAPSEAPQAASSIIPSLEVKVVDTKNPPAPIADATVSVVRLSIPPIPIGSQKTDQNGIAVFSPLLPGL
ncbi:MAG: hypothetical protein N3F67_06360, partial [Acidilobaceae archaeon]|nr:hypothetical protein [Acidilobaceae archaeon]